MRYFALATDYDGTIATHGKISPATQSAIERFRATGRRTILVTGRILDDLMGVCPCIELFDYVVAENGAILYHPKKREIIQLADPPPRGFVSALQNKGIRPLSVGDVITATVVPHEVAVLETIHELGLELQVIFNKEAVMILPAGVNKATGLEQALHKMGLSFHEVIGVGDAENDHSFLRQCECSAAVANAIQSIKDEATLITNESEGEGVTELMEEVIANDLERVGRNLRQRYISIGAHENGTDFLVPPYGINILVAGPSGSGKSTLATGFIERLLSQKYQICVIDPEGEYGNFDELIPLGDQQRAPRPQEVLALLEDPKVSASVNLLGVPLNDRPEFFSQLLPRLQGMRARSGRPHWILIDEAHHLLPASSGIAPVSLPRRLTETVLLTVHPDHVAPSILSMIDTAIAVGSSPDETLQKVAQLSQNQLSPIPRSTTKQGEVLVWFLRESSEAQVMKVIPGQTERIRHFRKYAEGNLGQNSFYFRGPLGKQNLRAQNLSIFCQISEGIDDETWIHHLKHKDYSRWFRTAIKDEFLASEADLVEQREDLPPSESKRKIGDAIKMRYTLAS